MKKKVSLNIFPKPTSGKEITDNANSKNALTSLDPRVLNPIENPYADKSGKEMQSKNLSQAQKQAGISTAPKLDIISKLTRFSIDLSMLPSGASLEEFIPKRIKELTGAIAVIFSEYDRDVRTLNPKHIEMDPGLLSQVLSLLGKQYQKIKSPIDNEAYELITQNIVGSYNTLREASFGAIPGLIGDMISSLLKAESYIGITYLIEGQLYGTSLLAMSKNQPDPPVEVLENIAFLTAVSLRRKQADEALNNERLLLRTLIDNIPDSIYSKDLSCRKTLANLTDIRYMGATRESEVIGKDDFDFYPRELADQFFADDQLVLKTGMPVLNREEYIFDKEGKKQWLLSSKLPLRNTNNQIIGLLGIGRDITDRKNDEIALQQSEEKYRSLIQNMGEGVGILNEEDDFFFVNQSAEKIFGIESGKLVGLNLTEFLVGENIELIKNETNKRRKGESSVFEHEIVLHDGSKKDILVTVTPRFEKDRYIGTFAIFRDITDRKRAEIAINESEALYRNLVEKLPDGVYKSTQEGKFVEVNPAMVSMLGYSSKEELLAIDIKTQLYFSPEDRESVELSEKLEKVGVYRMKKKDGSEILVEDHGWLNYDEKLKILFHEGIMRDVTESKRAELALRESEELYRNLVERLPDGVYKSTHDGKFVEVNPAMVKILGYDSKEELMAIDIKTELYFKASDRESSDLEEKQEELGLYRLRKKDGSEIWVEDHGWYISDDTGKILFHEGIMRDITDRKEAEKALEYEHYLLHSLMNNVPAHIYFKDSESRFIRINEAHARSFGLTDPGLATGKTDFDFFTEEHAQKAYDDEQEIIRTGKPVSKEEKETWFTNPDTWVSTTKMPLLDNDKNITGTFGISLNITERKKAEDELRIKNEELQKLNIEKDKFFSIIAHDLRGPFSGFVKLTEMLTEGLPEMTPADILKIARVMKSSAASLNLLISNLLEWSLMQRGITTFNPTSFALLPKVQENIALASVAAIKKEIEISCEIPEEFIISADENMLAGILRNLITNAVKFTPKQGNIQITAKLASDNQVQISIQDTGIGMSAQMITDLFRLDINTSRKGTEGESSSGLGLIICKDFVEKHGGTLWVESYEGKGSTFYFTLPAAIARQETKPVNNAFPLPENKIPDKNLKILIVENDETSAMLISIALAPYSKQTITTGTGVEAIEICRQNPDIDLIMMDIQMPEMNGYEATRHIREFNKKVVIIIQTAYVYVDDEQKALNSGSNEFITKPLNLETLKELVHKYFSG